LKSYAINVAKSEMEFYFSVIKIDTVSESNSIYV